MGRCSVFHHIHEYKGGDDDSINVLAVHYLTNLSIFAGLNGLPHKISVNGGNRTSNSILFSSTEPTVSLGRRGLGTKKRWPSHSLNSEQKFSLIQRCFPRRNHPLVEISLKLFIYSTYRPSQILKRRQNFRNGYSCYICLLTELTDCGSNGILEGP